MSRVQAGLAPFRMNSFSYGTGLITCQLACDGYQTAPRETFKHSTDPPFVDKGHDIVGLYVNLPERALVLCVYEMSQIQALNHTQPARTNTSAMEQPRYSPLCLWQPVKTSVGTSAAPGQLRPDSAQAGQLDDGAVHLGGLCATPVPAVGSCDGHELVVYEPCWRDQAQPTLVDVPIGEIPVLLGLRDGQQRIWPERTRAKPYEVWMVTHQDLRHTARVRVVIDHLVRAFATYA